MKLKDKIAVITGAGKGIGRAIALAFCREGSRVIASDIDLSLANETASQIRSNGWSSIALKTDVSSQREVKELFKNVIDHFGRLDILVNNAGVFSKTPILEMNEKEWDRVVNVNLKGAFFCCKEALPLMFKQKYGKIVNLASLSGKRGGVTSGVNYSSSKAGVMALTRSLAKLSAPYNVIVNAVAPGIIDTEMISVYTPEMRQKQIHDIPLKRLGKPEEVANVIVFLVSDDASYIVGETININGGLLMD